MSHHEARDPNISDIFYYFEEHTDIETGRTVGRKIGVVQEIIVRKFLLQSDILTDSIVFEPKLIGVSGAEHKVEFVFFQPAAVYDFADGQSHTIGNLSIQLLRLDFARNRAQFLISNGTESRRTYFDLHKGASSSQAQAMLNLAHTNLKLSRIDDNPGRARLSLLHIDMVRASVESKRVGAQRFAGSDQLGSGIQTIEKAKQAALVAIDADLQFNGTIKMLADPNQPRSYISIVVLGNGVHWTPKDKSILQTYIDYTFLIPDSSIIRYAEYVRTLAEVHKAEFFGYFMSYFQGMTNTSPDSFLVSAEDFAPVCPEHEDRSLIEILENQIDEYEKFD